MMVLVVRVVRLVMMVVMAVVVMLLLLHARAGTGEVAAAVTGVALAALDRARRPHKCSRGALEVTRATVRIRGGEGEGGGGGEREREEEGGRGGQGRRVWRRNEGTEVSAGAELEHRLISH